MSISYKYISLKVKVAQSCPTLCNPVVCSLPGSSVHGILQARIQEWVAFSSPGDLSDPGIIPGSPTLRADALPSEPPRGLFETPWTVQSLEIFRPEYWSEEQPFRSPGDLPNPGIKPRSPSLQVDSLPAASQRKSICIHVWVLIGQVSLCLSLSLTHKYTHTRTHTENLNWFEMKFKKWKLGWYKYNSKTWWYT